MTVSFELMGRTFVGLNGGPEYKIGAGGISFVVPCESQDEVDTFWSRLADGGEEIACGWITDRYGIAVEVEPPRHDQLPTHGKYGILERSRPRERAQRVMGAMLQMGRRSRSPSSKAAAA